jgi:HEAT repeat protein
MPRRTEEEQADFQRALEAIGDEAPLSQAELDALSVLEGPDLRSYADVWRRLPAPARARLIRALHSAAEQRLRLDFSGINRVALDDEDEKVRLAAVECALEDRSPALLSRLVDLVRSDPSRQVRRAAAEDLARFTLLGELDELDPELTRRVRDRLLEVVRAQDEDPSIRTSALAALGYFSDEAMMHELAEAFTNPELRLGAVRGMGRSADPRWTDRLMPVLGSEDPQQREEAARALGEIEDERAVSPLVELVDDPVREVRLAAIGALGEIGGEEAREALLYVLEDPDDTVREAAERAVSELEERENDPLEL